MQCLTCPLVAADPLDTALLNPSEALALMAFVKASRFQDFDGIAAAAILRDAGMAQEQALALAHSMVRWWQQVEPARRDATPAAAKPDGKKRPGKQRPGKQLWWAQANAHTSAEARAWLEKSMPPDAATQERFRALLNSTREPFDILSRLDFVKAGSFSHDGFAISDEYRKAVGVYAWANPKLRKIFRFGHTDYGLRDRHRGHNVRLKRPTKDLRDKKIQELYLYLLNSDVEVWIFDASRGFGLWLEKELQGHFAGSLDLDSSSELNWRSIELSKWKEETGYKPPGWWERIQLDD